MYNVKLEKFEGPMDLLLELIEKEKLDITELSLAKITDQYLEHIRGNEDIRLGNLADFLSVAAKLILIKSRAILPSLRFSDEEEKEIGDLTHQIEEYKKFKDASLEVGKLFKLGRYSFSRSGFLGVKSVFYPPEGINAYDLKKYFLKVISEIPIVEKLQEEVVREIVTLEERIADIEVTIRKKVETSFFEITANAEDKVDVIISFLAMLEMVKQRVIDVEQNELFNDIRLNMKAA